MNWDAGAGIIRPLTPEEEAQAELVADAAEVLLKQWLGKAGEETTLPDIFGRIACSVAMVMLQVQRPEGDS